MLTQSSMPTSSPGHTAEKFPRPIILPATAAVDTWPEEYEVKRRLCWFVGSLFMQMPTPPPVSSMHSWTIMTPFYSEDLLYSAKELAAKTEDGVSTLIFLKTVHGNEWNNFLERIGVGKSKEERQFDGLLDCIKKIYKTDGLGGLYQGFAASIAGIIVYRAAFFGGFDTLKSVALQAGFGAAVWQAFIVAEITTTIAGLVSYPFDTVRRRLMMKSGGGSTVEYNGTIDCAVKIIQKEGVGGLFNGALSNIFRGTGAAIVLVLYDWMSKFI